MRELKPFKAPTFELKPRRVVTIPFRGNLATVSDICDATNLITYPFRIIEVKMIFTDEANNWIRHRWLAARTRRTFPATTAPIAGVPGIDNIFQRESPAAEFRGKAIIRVVPCAIEFPEGMMFIYLYTHNAGPYAYEYAASVTIEAM